MEAVVVDAGSKLLKAGIAAPDQAPPLVSTRISGGLSVRCVFFCELFDLLFSWGVLLLGR
jgi:hypothetical protein